MATNQNEFKTLGLFGYQCPQITNSTLSQLAMYDYNTKSTLPGFPLEIFTKIFWGADEIKLEASCTASNSRKTTTFSGEISVKWGEIVFAQAYSGPPTIVRESVTTAKEMLCLISDPMSDDQTKYSHTFKNTLGSVSPRGSIQIRKRPYIQNNQLFAPFSINFEGAIDESTGAQIFINPIQPPSRAVMAGNAQWVTPWGNFTTPYYFFDFLYNASHISSYMTITITAADPAIRYA